MKIVDEKGMYTIEYNEGKNRIIATVHKMLYGEDFQRYGNELVGVIAVAEQGFTMLFDMSESKAKTIGEDDVNAIKNMKSYALSKGMKQSAFVMLSQTLRSQLRRNLEGTLPEDGFFDNLKEASSFLD